MCLKVFSTLHLTLLLGNVVDLTEIQSSFISRGSKTVDILSPKEFYQDVFSSFRLTRKIQVGIFWRKGWCTLYTHSQEVSRIHSSYESLLWSTKRAPLSSLCPHTVRFALFLLFHLCQKQRELHKKDRW